MNAFFKLSATAMVAAILSTSAAAQSVGKTRAEVKAELEAARNSGELMYGGEAGMRLRDMYPGSYPTFTPAGQGKTREQVRAELARAIANGEMVVDESGQTEYELAPQRFPQRPALLGKTRAEVVAELQLAQRLGDIVVAEAGLTMADMFPAVYAAPRAAYAAEQRAREASLVAQRGGASQR